MIKNLNTGKLTDRARSGQSGFTLVEMLIVLLIIGILAALAIPAFFSQREKATDADAKSAVDTAHTALESYSTQANGSFAGATLDDLKRIEGTLSNFDGVPADEPVLTLMGLGDDTYTIQVLSATGTAFSLSRESSGTLEYTCAPVSTGGCPASGHWD